MSTGLHTPSGPGQVLASTVRLESWRICSWFDPPEGEDRAVFNDTESLDTWLRQFEPARLRELASLLAGDYSQSPRDDDAIVLDLALRARDDTIGEVMQARLIPRAEPVLLSDEEQREAIAGVKADLQLLIDERTGY